MPPLKLSTMLKSNLNPHAVREPLWKGPEDKGDLGGITYSMLTRFLTCRERFRLYAIEGLRSSEGFNHRMEYGNMWHVCEEAMANYAESKPDERIWGGQLLRYAQKLAKENPTQQEYVDHWYNVCRAQFPFYVEYWSKHKDVTTRRPILAEQVFHIPYQLPSRRTVYLRGKWDSVDLAGSGKACGIDLQENKSKGDIDEMAIQRQLTFDCQTMIYMIALTHDTGIEHLENLKLKYKVRGVRYNVIRRPLSGGRGNIRQLKPTKKNPQGESKEAYYLRLAEYFREEPEYFFMRWYAEVTPTDMKVFRKRFLDPILEQLCDWYSWVSKSSDPFSESDGVENSLGQSVRSAIHWQHPFGSINSIDEYGASDVDDYMMNGNQAGLHHVDTLFPELR